jgi:hypothetical protein
MEEANPIKMHWIQGRGIAVFAAWILVFSLTAVSYGANQDTAEAKIDYGMAQQDILKFEQAIGLVIGDTFKDMVSLVQRPKGCYLPGYGISVTFMLNIHRAVMNTPFGPVRRATVSPESKMRRIEEFKEKLIRVLQENGGSFRQLRKEDSVAIVAFFEDRNIPDEPNANKTIVLSASKKDLDELGNRTDRLKEFKQRMKIVEY